MINEWAGGWGGSLQDIDCDSPYNITTFLPLAYTHFTHTLVVTVHVDHVFKKVAFGCGELDHERKILSEPTTVSSIQDILVELHPQSSG